MSQTNSLREAGRQVHQEVNEADVITTTQGGADVAKAAARSGAFVGFNSHTTRPPDEIPIDFVDWPYQHEADGKPVSFIHHLLVVEREQPTYAVAPDITADRDLDKVITMADALAQHAETVIVVPKTVRPERVPDRFRVGVPFRNGFDGLPWPVWEFQNCEPLHILGGNPNKQIELAAMLPRVASLDTAHPTMSANWGKIWCGPDEGYTQKQEGYYGSIEISMRNLVKRWANDPPDARLRRSAAKLFFDIPVPDFGADDDVDESEETMTVNEVLNADLPLLDYVPSPSCYRSKERVPHPGRAYFQTPDETPWNGGMTFGDLDERM